MGSNRTILVIDDNELVRDVVRAMLEAKGYDVLVAEDGVNGLDLLAGNRVDAVLVDVDMPGMNGIEVCRALRDQALGIGRSLWIWLMTGVMRPGLTARALAAGARGVLSKPFTTDQLVGCIEGEFRPRAPA